MCGVTRHALAKRGHEVRVVPWPSPRNEGAAMPTEYEKRQANLEQCLVY